MRVYVQGAFHGRTMGAMALTSSKTFYKTGFAPLMPQTFIAPFPYCLHCKVRQTAPDGKDWYKVSICLMSLQCVGHVNTVCDLALMIIYAIFRLWCCKIVQAAFP